MKDDAVDVLTTRSAARMISGVVRAGVVLVVLAAIALASVIRSAQARTGELLHGFGAQLLEWQDARLHSAPRRITLNGLELQLVSATSQKDVGSTLDRFEVLCHERGGIAAPQALRGKLPAVLGGTFRQESSGAGVLACIDSGRPLELDEIATRIQRFAATGDLSALGDLRYVVARTDGQSTTVLVAWTEGPTPLLRALAKAGDAPGRDPSDVPRPSGLRRVLSAAEHGQPYSVSIYRSEERSGAALLEWYERSLVNSGWTTMAREAGADSLVARRGVRTVLIRVGRHRNGGEPVVSIVELS